MVPELGTTVGSYQSRKPLVPYDFCVGKVTYLDSPPQRKPGLDVFLHGKCGNEITTSGEVVEGCSCNRLYHATATMHCDVQMYVGCIFYMHYIMIINK